MRTIGFSALAAAIAILAMTAPQQANASDHSVSQHRSSRHWVYYPRYHHFYPSTGSDDPYAYSYEQRGYYPYYNSGYWKRRQDVALKRSHFHAPKYFRSWGANRTHWDQAKWHADHHSNDRRGER
jgi:hypothetical protein